METDVDLAYDWTPFLVQEGQIDPVISNPVEMSKVARIQASSRLSKAANGTIRPIAMTPPEYLT